MMQLNSKFRVAYEFENFDLFGLVIKVSGDDGGFGVEFWLRRLR